MKLFLLILTALCCIIYATQWYLGLPVPAWAALVWCGSCFITELKEYWENK